MKKISEKIIAVIISAAIVLSCFAGYTAFAQSALLKQYTFSDGMPEEFTPCPTTTRLRSRRLSGTAL